MKIGWICFPILSKEPSKTQWSLIPQIILIVKHELVAVEFL